MTEIRLSDFDEELIPPVLPPCIENQCPNIENPTCRDVLVCLSGIQVLRMIGKTSIFESTPCGSEALAANQDIKDGNEPTPGRLWQSTKYYY